MAQDKAEQGNRTSEEAAATLLAEAPAARGRPPRSVHAARDLTEGSIPRNLWSLAWPGTVAGSVNSLDMLAEIAWAGFLGAQAIAGVGAAQTWVQLINTGRTGLDASARAMIARAVGARDLPRANHIAGQVILLNGTVALTVMVVGLVLTEFLLLLLGVSAGVLAEGAAYLRWRFVSTTTNTFLQVNHTILQAAGDPISPMKAQSVTKILHILFAPFLIFGWGVPAMGISGSSCGFALTQLVGIAMTSYALYAGRSSVRPALRGIRPDFPLLWRMVRIGAPASVTNGERSLAQLVLVGIVAPFGDLALAAYTLTQRMQMFVNLGQQGLGQAAGVLVGQNLGAQETQRARSTTWWALSFTIVLTTVIGGLLWLFPEAAILVFTRERVLVEAAIPWLQIMLLGCLGMGVGNVFMQVFNTAGDTGFPMWVSLVSIWVIQQPLALALSGTGASFELLGRPLVLPTLTGLGDIGIAWAITAAITVRLLAYLPYFWWGPWWRPRDY